MRICAIAPIVPKTKACLSWLGPPDKGLRNIIARKAAIAKQAVRTANKMLSSHMLRFGFKKDSATAVTSARVAPLSPPIQPPMAPKMAKPITPRTDGINPNKYATITSRQRRIPRLSAATATARIYVNRSLALKNLHILRNLSDRTYRDGGKIHDDQQRLSGE